MVELAKKKATPKVSNSLASLNATIVREAANILKEHIKASKTSLIEGYASCMWTNDFLHTAGLISEECFVSVNILATAMQAVSTTGEIASIFGANSPFTPSLRYLTEQAAGMHEGGEDELTSAVNAAAGTALSAALEAAL